MRSWRSETRRYTSPAVNIRVCLGDPHCPIVVPIPDRPVVRLFCRSNGPTRFITDEVRVQRRRAQVQYHHYADRVGNRKDLASIPSLLNGVREARLEPFRNTSRSNSSAHSRRTVLMNKAFAQITHRHPYLDPQPRYQHCNRSLRRAIGSPSPGYL